MADRISNLARMMALETERNYGQRRIITAIEVKARQFQAPVETCLILASPHHSTALREITPDTISHQLMGVRFCVLKST
jgi:hypothetical protein